MPVFPPAAKVSLLAPPSRSTDIEVVSAPTRVMVSLPVPPVMVSVLDTVALLVPLRKGERVAGRAEVDCAVGDGDAEGDGIGAAATDDASGVLDGAGIGDIVQNELVGAGAEVDRHGGG